MVEPPENSWGHVPECANGCTYSIQYDAPALSCRDLRSDEYTVQDYSSTNSTTTSWKFYDLNDHELWGYDEWTIDIPPFIANYVPVSLTSDGSHAPTFETLGARTGSSCQCQDGKYETRFTYKENLITLDTTLSYTNSFTNNCTANLFPLSYECLNYGINALATCQDFAFALQGSLSVDLTNGRSSNSNFRPLILEKIGSYSTNTSGDGNVYFKPKFANLTQALLEYFSNLTVSLIPWLNGTTEMDIEVLDSGSLWDYDPYQLWEVYAPALGAVFLAVLYGLFCIHANSETGRGMDSKFSTLLKTTRNQQLDEMYQKAGDFDNLLRSRLVYAKRGHFMPHPKEKELSEA